MSCPVFSRHLSGNPAIQLAATKPPGTAQFESRCLPLLGQPINGLFPCLEIDRHFVQRENFAIGLVHIRLLTMAFHSEVFQSLAKFTIWPTRMNPESHVREAIDSVGATRCGRLVAPVRLQGHVF